MFLLGKLFICFCNVYMNHAWFRFQKEKIRNDQELHEENQICAIKTKKGN